MSPLVNVRIMGRSLVTLFTGIKTRGTRLIAELYRCAACDAWWGSSEHGDMNPDTSLMIGGHYHTVAEVEMDLDHLHSYVCALTF
jgi:hypothetical protein